MGLIDEATDPLFNEELDHSTRALAQIAAGLGALTLLALRYDELMLEAWDKY